ncbi:MAG: hypothetical protein PHN44_02445 [Candidatus Marinimicrobia bacterium]|nr:hypothetical protein [Candidatus Neomarinimicrobiota bacterium]MDD5172811.1 hypothetical protein [Patescibacteria group bacterium]MDD5540926.1 hypothetical protein [Candidatus Neomarinimicrobiota bacterium]
MAKKNIIISLIVSLVIVLVLVYFQINKDGKTELTEEKEPQLYVLSEEEINELAQEAQNMGNQGLAEENEEVHQFKVSSSPDSYPKFVSGTTSPQRPKLGEDHLISIKMRDPNGVKSVTLEIMDQFGKTLIEKMNMEFIDADRKEGQWVATWKVHSVGDVFRAKFLAENELGQTDDLTYFIRLDGVE